MDGADGYIYDDGWGTRLYAPQTANKLVFVNRNIIQNTFQTTNMVSNGKILINPKFKQNVHVNPHFNKSKPTSSTSIFVNPNIMRPNMSEIRSTYLSSTSAIKSATNISSDTSALIVDTIPKETRKVVESVGTGCKSKGAVIKNTRTKLIRATCPITPTKQIKSEKKSGTGVKVRQKVCTRYRLIRRSLSNDHSKVEETKNSNLKKLYYIKNRFKIDKSLQWKKQAVANSPAAKLLRKRRQLYNFSSILNTKNVYVKKDTVLNKTQFVSINGILYRKNLNKLKKTSNTLSSGQKKGKGGKLITIRGQKYKLDANHRTLTCLSTNKTSNTPNVKRIDIGGITFKQREPNVFVKTDVSRKQILLSQAKQKSINILVNRMRKCNIPCPFYRKFGKCRGKEKGTCNRVHNPDQVSLCPKFLQGACFNKKCLLSHKVSPEKMPTCKFFLEGLCTREDCQYLHVKINAKADICRNFLEGFCERGRECDKRHQYLCPNYEKHGKCLKKRCPYPHANVVRKRKISIKVASESSNPRQKVKTNNSGNTSNSPQVFEVKTPKGVCNECKNIEGNCVKTRYYIDNQDLCEIDSSNAEILCLDSESDGSDIETGAPVTKRPKLGSLPSFIPFEST